MSNSSQIQMRELGGLVDNLYLSSKNRHPHSDASATPNRTRRPKGTSRSRSGSRTNSENAPLSHGINGGGSGSGGVPTSPAKASRSKRGSIQQPGETKRFNTTLSRSKGGASLTGKRWDLSCFTMGKPIGKGRFGNVYLAREKASMKVLALKIMLKKDLEAAGVYHQVKSEIDIHVNYGLKCPHLLKAYGYFYDEKRIFIVMEYARKGELYRAMKTQPTGRFTEPVAARYIYQLVRALQYLHTINVIHRDIKPENLLLDKAGNLRLCDFGWSIEVMPYSTRQTICGTQDYLAPEMLMERPYTTSVDLWAAGVVAYEFLIGRSPFRKHADVNGRQTCEGVADTLSRIERGAFDFPEDPVISPEAKDFITRLLRVEPADRMTLEDAVMHPWLKQPGENEAPREAAAAAACAPSSTLV
ncbi:unnamed protein product [Ascophyllum nodosum]